MVEERNQPGKGFRLLIWTAVGFQMVMMAALVVIAILGSPYGHTPQESVGAALVGIAGLLVFPVVGLVIFSCRPNHPIGWLFCLSQIGWVLNNFANAFGLYALRARPELLSAARWAVWFYLWPGYLSTALFLFLILLFPDGRLPSPRWKPVAWLIAAWAGIAVISSAFAWGPVDTSGVLTFNNPLGVSGPPGIVLAGVANAIGVLTVPLFLFTGISLVLRFRSAREQTRQQLKWLAAAIVFIMLMVAVEMALIIAFPTAAATPLWAVALEQFSILSLTLFPIAAGIAILRYRLYEIDRIINQALVYFSLTAALALVYFGCIVVLQSLLSAITGEGHSSIATVLSTLAIAALFTPLRRRFQRLIDRRFYRQKYNSEVILDRFSGVARSEVDLQLMSDQLVSVVEEAFQPLQASLWLHKLEK